MLVCHISIKWKGISMCISHKTEICHFVHIIILSPLYSLSLPFFLEKTTQPYSLGPSACLWPIYKSILDRSLTNLPLKFFLSSPSPLHWKNSVYWRSRLRIKLWGFVFREYLEQGLEVKSFKFQSTSVKDRSLALYTLWLYMVSSSCEQFTMRSHSSVQGA